MTWKELEQFDYERLLNDALSNVTDKLDKREGSVVYDMIAPAMYELAYVVQMFVEAGKGSLLQNATGATLDDFALRQGLYRYQATHAKLLVEVRDMGGALLDIPISTRFTSIDVGTTIAYQVLERLSTGVYRVEAEVAGGVGNSYLGAVNPLSTIPNFGSATLTEVETLAVDEETDLQLRDRVMKVIAVAPFGGNVADYDLKAREINGIASAQVYPTWNGGGTVKISLIGSGGVRLDSAKLDEVQQIIDPTKDGRGLGTAPIGHIVTVVTPTNFAINFVIKITTVGDFTVGQLAPEITTNLENYLSELRGNWGKPDSMNNYSLQVIRSRVISEIMAVTGVENVTTLTMNGSTGDLTLTEDSTTQQLPIMGTINIT